MVSNLGEVKICIMAILKEYFRVGMISAGELGKIFELTSTLPLTSHVALGMLLNLKSRHEKNLRSIGNREWIVDFTFY